MDDLTILFFSIFILSLLQDGHLGPSHYLDSRSFFPVQPLDGRSAEFITPGTLILLLGFQQKYPFIIFFKSMQEM